MKEIPFLRHHPLLPLPAVGNGVSASASRRRTIVASTNNTPSNDLDGASGGAIGVTLAERRQRAAGGDADHCSDARSTALVPAGDDDTADSNGVASPPPGRRFYSNNNNAVANREESQALLRGLSSVHRSEGDGRVVFTSGVAGRPGSIRISAREAPDAARRDDSNAEEAACSDLDVDLSPLANETSVTWRGSSASFEHPVGVACFVTTARRPSASDDDDVNDAGDEDEDMGESHSLTSTPRRLLLHLHAVDTYGTVLSLAFSYPDLTPVPGASYLLPLSPRGGGRLLPHPGSSVEINQVCFPTPHAVVFALNPHLYCVDLGKSTGTIGGGGGTAVATTRVWTSVHRVVCDPILACPAAGEEATGGGSGMATPTPRKKARKSTFGSILTSLIGMGDSGYGGDDWYEYDDDDYEELVGANMGGELIVPSIAALTNLPSLLTMAAESDDGSNDIARVVTIHSDGSLRVWVALPSRRVESDLRVPSVQRLAVSRAGGSWIRSESAGYEDPPIPPPSAWDPTCRGSDAVVLRGRCERNPRGGGWTYEVALYVQCYPAGVRNGGEESKSVHVFRGSVLDADAHHGDELPTGDVCAKAQELVLPAGTRSVADVSYGDGSLMVLLRCRKPSAGAEDAADFYNIGEGGEHDAKMALALYPSLGRQGYSKDAVLPSNTTLPYFGFNHFGDSSLGLCVEEEMDRYIARFAGVEDNGGEESEEDVMETSESAVPSLASATTEAEAKIDRAGLLAILQPFGRCRPSALAVRRAMSSMSLVDQNELSASSLGEDSVRPATILSAMRKWKNQAVFQQSSTSRTLVPVSEPNKSDEASPTASNGGSLSIYHTFASATKNGSSANRGAARWDDDDEEDDDATLGTNGVEAAQRAHRSRWVRLLFEIRRQEYRLEEVLCLGTIAAASSLTNLLVRGSGVSVLTVDDGPALSDAGAGGSMAARLDELAVELLACVASDPELRQLLCRVESALYDGASRASSLVDGWSHKSSDLMSKAELLGRSAVARMSLNDSQIHLLGDLSCLRSNFAEMWLNSPLSASSSVSAQLGLSRPSFAPTPNNATTNAPEGSRRDANDSLLSSAASLVSGQLESARRLSLSRLILVMGSPQKQGSSSLAQRGALRSALYSASLSWAIQQTSSVEKCWTVLEEHLTRKETRGPLGMMAAMPLADEFFASAFRYYDGDTSSDSQFLNLIFSQSQEPRVALRLIAPLVEFPPQSTSPPKEESVSQDQIRRKRREVAAECLLAEAAAIAKHAKSAAKDETSPGTLWSVASTLLLDAVSFESTVDASQIQKLIHRVGVLERHLNPMEGSKTHMPPCCGVVLDAVQDAISAISSSHKMTEEIPPLWSIAFQISMRGHLWDDALHACVHNPLVDQKRADLKRLILGMVEANALGKMVDMSLTVRELSTSMLCDDEQGVITEGTTTGVDLFELAAKIIEEAAYEQASISTESETEEESVVTDRPNYWGSLYTLHASRGNWRQAAYAMDMCGKATANSVLSTKSVSPKPLVLSKAASKTIMDDACLSAQACVHAVSLVDKVSRRYLLPAGSDQDKSSSESRLLTEEDLERRAARALALRVYSMDGRALYSVGAILKSTSRDTIDSLAMLGYYDQAIAVASGLSSKRKGLPGGVDLFDDALKHILCTYLVPAATKSRVALNIGGGGDLERSKVAQFRASSSACALLGSVNNRVPLQSQVTPSSVNSKSWVSNAQCEKALQETMAMGLLHQYTTVYSTRCPGLALHVASTFLQVGDGMSELPRWLRELCMFGSIPMDEASKYYQNALFAQRPSSKESCINANPAGLMRLLVQHHQYGEACDVLIAILSSRSKNAPCSCRLPEEGSIDYVPYDLIDMLWNIIESISTTAHNSNFSGEYVKPQIQSLIQKRTRMENALEKHFESLRISEEGMKSARALVCP